MSSQTALDDQNQLLPPPSGDPERAEKYINQLINLMDQDKLDIFHTDLTKFDPTNLQDHYRVDLNDYKVEISHSKHPNSGKDSYVMLFTNIKNMAENNCEKIILAYMHLDDTQFMRIKRSYLEQDARKKKAAEEKRLKEALKPVDAILEDLSNNNESEKTAMSNFSVSTPAIS